MHLIVHTAFFSVPVFLCQICLMSMPRMIVHVCKFVCLKEKEKIETLCAVEGKKRRKKKKWPLTGKCLNIVCQNIKYI